MTSKIRARAEILATFRSISVQLMEMLARWVPTTGSMETKVLFGRHVWEFAQHADLLGKRTFELRAPLHFTLSPVESYASLIRDISAAASAAERVAYFYDGLLPGLEQRYRQYLATTDTLLDEPSVRVIEFILASLARMSRESTELRQQLPSLKLPDGNGPKALAHREAAVPDIVSHQLASVAGGA